MSEMADDSFDAQFRELDYDDDVERELEVLKSGGALNPAIEAELSSLREEGSEPAELAATNEKPSA